MCLFLTFSLGFFHDTSNGGLRCEAKALEGEVREMCVVLRAKSEPNKDVVMHNLTLPSDGQMYLLLCNGISADCLL